MAGVTLLCYIKDHFDHPVDRVKWPASLLQLTFGDHFNQPIDGVAVGPASLTHLTFGKQFNQPIISV